MFRPYRGNDVRGYVNIRGIWMQARRGPSTPGSVQADTILIERLGWGDTYGGELIDYALEEQAQLLTTLEVRQ